MRDILTTPNAYKYNYIQVKIKIALIQKIKNTLHKNGKSKQMKQDG